eukprot:2494096-Rhodomonas_salina.1
MPRGNTTPLEDGKNALYSTSVSTAHKFSPVLQKDQSCLRCFVVCLPTLRGSAALVSSLPRLCRLRTVRRSIPKLSAICSALSPRPAIAIASKTLALPIALPLASPIALPMASRAAMRSLNASKLDISLSWATDTSRGRFL